MHCFLIDNIYLNTKKKLSFYLYIIIKMENMCLMDGFKSHYNILQIYLYIVVGIPISMNYWFCIVFKTFVFSTINTFKRIILFKTSTLLTFN